MGKGKFYSGELVPSDEPLTIELSSSPGSEEGTFDVTVDNGDDVLAGEVSALYTLSIIDPLPTTIYYDSENDKWTDEDNQDLNLDYFEYDYTDEGNYVGTVTADDGDYFTMLTVHSTSYDEETDTYGPEKQVVGVGVVQLGAESES